jgi:hypothetical protein
LKTRIILETKLLREDLSTLHLEIQIKIQMLFRKKWNSKSESLMIFLKEEKIDNNKIKNKKRKMIKRKMEMEKMRQMRNSILISTAENII